MIASPPLLSGEAATVAAPFVERILLAALFVAMLVSSIAVIEPSPHDGVVVLVALVGFIAGLKFERPTLLLLMLLLVWNAAGMIALARIATDSKAIQYAATTFYMSAAAVLFAALVSTHTMTRLASLRAGYLASAVVAGLAGIAGHFHLFPGAEMFEEYGGRAMGMFKDPNVYAPYLIWPALFLVSRILTRGFFPRDLAMLGIIMGGLFLSFSRGAWGHFLFSAAITVVLMILTAPSVQTRRHIVMLSVGGLAAAAVLIVVMMAAIPSVHDMFFIRAQAIQDYDVGEGGRFRLQELALNALLDYPLGMGPFEFGRKYGLQQHNVYLQAFIVYGWLGGVTYILTVITTIVLGFRALVVRTPWQIYLITAFAAFVGEAAEGFIIDTDHWRHFFLLLGLVWGLSAATFSASELNKGAANAVAWR